MINALDIVDIEGKRFFLDERLLELRKEEVGLLLPIKISENQFFEIRKRKHDTENNQGLERRVFYLTKQDCDDIHLDVKEE